MGETVVRITEDLIGRFERHLQNAQKSAGTIEHYCHAVKVLMNSLGQENITMGGLLRWKEHAAEVYSIQSVNAMIAAVNAFLRFCALDAFQVKAFKVQRKVFLDEKLTEKDVEKLMLNAKKKGDWTAMVLIALLSETGIRVSEVQYITTEAVEKGMAVITLKGKTREILLSANLRKILKNYIKLYDVTSGPVILDRNGRPMNRRRIWERLKKTCAGTDVDPKRVHPHAFRHLFARVFYALSHDLAKLADLLGHSSVNTTRIYLADTVDVHRGLLDQVSENLSLRRWFPLRN